MARENPTIIVGHLNDAELKKSIDALVAHVEQGTKKMVDNFNTSIDTMKRKLNELGSVKVDMGGTADGGSSRRTSAVEKETKARKELIATFDQQASGMQKAIPQKNTAEDSYYTFIKNMRENLALLAMEIKSMPSMSLDKQFGVYMQYERQIEQVRHKIAELRQQMQEMATDPNASRLVKKQTLEEIGTLEQKIVQLVREQITATQQIANEDKRVLAEKQARYDKEKQELIALSAGERERVTFAQQQNSELDKQIQKIKEITTAKEAKSAFVNIAAMPTDTYEQAKEKLELLQQLMAKVRDTPLMSKSNVELLQRQIWNTAESVRRFGAEAPQASEKIETATRQYIKSESELRQRKNGQPN